MTAGSPRRACLLLLGVLAPFLFVCMALALVAGTTWLGLWEAPGMRLSINGDAKAIGALICSNGRIIGAMEEGVYSGPARNKDQIEAWRNAQLRRGIAPTMPPRPGDRYSVGVSIGVTTGKSKRSIFSEMPYLPFGPQLLVVRRKEGECLAMVIDVTGECYVGVNFGTMKIIGGSEGSLLPGKQVPCPERGAQ